MTVYELIKEVEELSPCNISEVKSKIAMPIYRFVTSANFTLGLIVIALLLATMFLYSAYAYTQDVIDRNGIQNIKVQDLKQSSKSNVVFDYCLNKYSKDTVGALVTSDLDTTPIPIESDKIKYGQCALYGTKVLADSDTVKITLFQKDRIDALVSSFNAKVHDMKDAQAQVNQKINQYKKLGYDDEKIQSLTEKVQLLELQIKSAQSGLKTLITMKES